MQRAKLVDMTEMVPVGDWANDYEIFEPSYAADPTPVWADLREHCPIAHSDCRAGSCLPVKYADVQAIPKMPDYFSSSDPLVVPLPEAMPRDKAWEKYSANAPGFHRRCLPSPDRRLHRQWVR
jgi:hypothetical protein